RPSAGLRCSWEPSASATRAASPPPPSGRARYSRLPPPCRSLWRSRPCSFACRRAPAPSRPPPPPPRAPPPRPPADGPLEGGRTRLVLGVGLAYAAFSVGLELLDIPFTQEIVLVGSAVLFFVL